MLVHKNLVPADLSDEDLLKFPGVVTVLPTPTGFVAQSKDLSLYWQFDLNKVQYGNDVLHLVRSRSGEWVIVWGSDIHESKDSLSSVLMRKNIDSFFPLLIIGIAPNKKDFTALLFCNSKEPNNPSPITDNERESGDMSLKRLMPSIAPLIDRWHAKYKLLKDTKTNDALAALEAQVDLLSMWVSALIPEEYRQILLDAGVLKLKDTQVAFDDMVAFKRALRDRQKAYLAITTTT